MFSRYGVPGPDLSERLCPELAGAGPGVDVHDRSTGLSDPSPASQSKMGDCDVDASAQGQSGRMMTSFGRSIADEDSHGLAPGFGDVR